MRRIYMYDIIYGYIYERGLCRFSCPMSRKLTILANIGLIIWDITYRHNIDIIYPLALLCDL
jgi:polyferredoxin